MKKFICFLCAAVLSISLPFGIVACGQNEALSVYVPDGAPALSVVSLCEDSDFNLTVVKPAAIKGKVSGGSPEADIAILPVNDAVDLLGDGESYKLLGTVTHGNLFLLKKPSGEEITNQNLFSLVGKTVGIVNMASFPGLAFKVILKDNSLDYNELVEDVQKVEDKVNLINVEATQVKPDNADCDYFVMPEPAVSTKVSVTGGRLSVAASLQELYGNGGYPQAVAVAKTSVITSNKQTVKKFIDSFESSKARLTAEDFNAESIVSALQAKMVDDLAPTFTAANLSLAVVANCGINFVNATQSKVGITSFMNKLNAVAAESYGVPADGFFADIV